jgi:hypothetical protein
MPPPSSSPHLAHPNCPTGVYLTTSLGSAKAIARRHFLLGTAGDGLAAVAVCEVDLGVVVCLYDTEEGLAEWHTEPAGDSVYARHPRWHGVDSFREYCVRDPRRVRLLRWEPA